MPAHRISRIRNVFADPIDFRDRTYQPSVVKAPPAEHDALADLRSHFGQAIPVLDQGSTNACTGFALASVVNYLRRSSGIESDASISAPMLYFMARRYDEFPGSVKDSGSSVRGALKGWFHHGAAAETVWSNHRLQVPPPRPKTPKTDWWFDAAQRPLGAYYRVDTKAIADLHVALAEVGVLYASAACHSEWLDGFAEERHETKGIWEIPVRKAAPDDGGHAFVIYGYDHEGFLIQNSWGEAWGTGGRARLRYEDWLANAMDCWVAQSGVATAEHLEVAAAGGLRVRAGRVALSSDEILRDREISPFIIDMENNGELSTSGRFRTSEGDVRSLLTDLIPKAREDWHLAPGTPIDVAIYAHGGLTTEGTAAKTAATWIPALYEAHIFPIFLVWETGMVKTLVDIAEEAVRGQPRPTGGIGERLDAFLEQRLERLLAAPGTAVWGEMKENAAQISLNSKGGARLLYTINKKLSPRPLEPRTTRLHLIGHSAGAIVHCHLVDQLARAGWTFDSVNFMAPAVRVDTFRDTLLPHLKSGGVRRLLQLHLSDAAEQKDNTCRAILGYGRSLLYLVSESFEGGERTPILGMEKYFGKLGALPNTTAHTPATIGSPVATHGGFDDDEVVRATVIAHILGQTAKGTVSTKAKAGKPQAREAAGAPPRLAGRRKPA